MLWHDYKNTPFIGVFLFGTTQAFIDVVVDWLGNMTSANMTSSALFVACFSSITQASPAPIHKSFAK